MPMSPLLRNTSHLAFDDESLGSIDEDSSPLQQKKPSRRSKKASKKVSEGSPDELHGIKSKIVETYEKSVTDFEGEIQQVKSSKNKAHRASLAELDVEDKEIRKVDNDIEVWKKECDQTYMSAKKMVKSAMKDVKDSKRKFEKAFSDEGNEEADLVKEFKKIAQEQCQQVTEVLKKVKKQHAMIDHLHQITGSYAISQF